MAEDHKTAEAPESDDETIIRRVLDGDSRAFELLVGRYQHRVAQFIWRVVRQEQDREEVCQDVFVKVFFKLDQFRFDAKFSTWLYKVAYRSAISFNRRKRLDTLSIENDEVSLLEVPVTEETQNESEQIKLEIDRQMANLKLEERTIVALYYLQEMTVEEISGIVERPAGTVKSILFRVRNKLQAGIRRSSPELMEVASNG
jgi:RNA polymerase sigma-70 factor (ECF subfamily)